MQTFMKTTSLQLVLLGCFARPVICAWGNSSNCSGECKSGEETVLLQATSQTQRSIPAGEVPKSDRCISLGRAYFQYNRIPKAALEVGVEGLKMSVMAYMLEDPDAAQKSADADKKAYGEDYPGDEAWKGRFSDASEFREDDEKIGSAGAFGYAAHFKSGDLVATAVIFAGTTPGFNSDTYADVASGLQEDADLGGNSFKIGKGFKGQWDKLVQKGLVDKVKQLAEKSENKIICAGHSLGGALANICAVYFANLLGAKVILRTYGSPRVFAWGSTEWIQGDGNLIQSSPNYGVEFPATKGIVSQRFTNFGDYVPILPACKMGFMHIGNGGIDLYDPWGDSEENKVGAFGWQHLDYTPWTGGIGPVGWKYATWHVLTKYYERMKDSLAQAK